MGITHTWSSPVTGHEHKVLTISREQLVCSCGTTIKTDTPFLELRIERIQDHLLDRYLAHSKK